MPARQWMHAERSQVLHTGGFIVAEWRDDFLQWNASDHDGIDYIIVPPDRVWLPDFALVNSAGAVYDSLYTSHFRPTVESSGLVIWTFGGNFATTCQLVLTYFPFDEQKCNFTIENWAYPASQVELLNRTDQVTQDNYLPQGEWDFARSEVIKEYIHHDVYQKTKFPKITFNLYLKRKPGYYMLNIVTPCCMIVTLALFVFWLPANSGEKVSLGITVLLGFSVFQLVIANNVPKTSDNTPLLSKYVAFIMGISCLSTILTIFTLYLHFRASAKRPNRFLRILFFNFFARICWVTVPDGVFAQHSPAPKDADMSEKEQNYNREDNDDKNDHTVEGDTDQVRSILTDDATSLLREIASDVHYIKMKKKEEKTSEEAMEEWKTLARVIDRVCFWVCLVVIISVSCHLFFG